VILKLMPLYYRHEVVGEAFLTSFEVAKFRLLLTYVFLSVNSATSIQNFKLLITVLTLFGKSRHFCLFFC
jgi:hypothetical protein